MQKELLNLTPKRYLCPFCGKWHKWNETHALEYYYSSSNTTNLRCCLYMIQWEYLAGKFQIYFKDDYCYFKWNCANGSQKVIGKIAISSFEQDPGEPIFTFKIPYKVGRLFETVKCNDCENFSVCQFLRDTLECYSEEEKIILGFQFERIEYKRMIEHEIETCKKYIKPKNEKAILKRL